MTRNTAAFGMYPDKIAAEESMAAFLRAGFRSTDISYLQPENVGTKDFAHAKHSKAPEGAVIGMIVGAVVGAALGWLAASGTLNTPVIPAIEPLFTAGPVYAALAALGAIGLVGAVIGALLGAGIPEYEARRYEGRVRNRGVLFSVHCDSSVWVKRARKLLKETGSTYISTRSEAKADFANSDKPHRRRVTVGA